VAYEGRRAATGRSSISGKNWDLWYRLGGAGQFIPHPEVLTRVRLGLPVGSPSRGHWREHRAIAALLPSLLAQPARSGHPETPLSGPKRPSSPQPTQVVRLPTGGLSIDTRRRRLFPIAGVTAARNGDPRCPALFAEAFRPRSPGCRSVASRATQCCISPAHP